MQGDNACVKDQIGESQKAPESRPKIHPEQRHIRQLLRMSSIALPEPD
jgi:hypothetical protein